MSDSEIVMSPLCREISGDGTRIQVDIDRGEDESGWILGVIDEENASNGKLWMKSWRSLSGTALDHSWRATPG